jgi:xanthine dehydrogenase molybdopterin-binding subunit B
LCSLIFQDIPGIVAFLSAKDIPGKNSFAPVGLILLDEDEEVSLLTQLQMQTVGRGVENFECSECIFLTLS